MNAANKLTAVAVKNMSKPGCYADGLGLYLQVSKFGTKSWLFRYMLHGRARKMGLGPVHTVTLAEAREKARDCRKLLLLDERVDPIEARRAKRMQARLAPARGVSFRECADKYIAA